MRSRGVAVVLGIAVVAACPAPLFLLLAACGSQFTTPPRTPGVSHPEPGGHFWVVADSQLNNVAGDREQSEFHDALENVAIRPVSLDLWSSLILKHVMRRIADANTTSFAPTFFLGDGANTSCEAEYVRFLAAIDQSRQVAPWFAALGNHDGFFMGNLAGPGVEGDWENACSREGSLAPELENRLAPWRMRFGSHLRPLTMPKAWAVLLYLDSLWQREIIPRDIDPLDMRHWKELMSRYGRPQIVFSATGHYGSAGSPSLSVQLDAAISNTGGWGDLYMAYVVQDVPIANGDHVLIMDTSDFVEPPPPAYDAAIIKGKARGVKDLPGELGMVSREQRDQLEQYAEKIPHGQHFWLASHHDWQSISIPGAFHIREHMFGKEGMISYVSGHTHNPSATGGVNGDHQWELNIASITDWPMEYAHVAYWPTWPGADISVRIVNSYEADDEGRCSLSRPSRGSVAGDEEDRTRELADAGDLYAKRGLELYKRLLERIKDAPSSYPEVSAVVDPSQVAERLARIEDVTAKSMATERLRSSLDKDARIKVLDNERKVLLHDLHVLDERILQLSPTVVEEERTCATWASHIEQEYWAGSIVGFVVRAISRPKIAKTVIEGGQRLLGHTIYHVQPSDLPHCPDGEQRRNWLSRLLSSGC